MTAKTREEIAREMRLRTLLRPQTAPAPVDAETPESVSARVLRQIRWGLDEERLLPGEDKRRRMVEKKLDRMARGEGWYVFAQASAYTIQNGKAPQRRNAEVAIVQEATRWREEVERYAPDRLAEFERQLDAAFANPKQGSGE